MSDDRRQQPDLAIALSDDIAVLGLNERDTAIVKSACGGSTLERLVETTRARLLMAHSLGPVCLARLDAALKRHGLSTFDDQEFVPRQTKPVMLPCSVYIMQSHGLTKIGISGDVTARLRGMQAQSAAPVTLLAWRSFADYRRAVAIEQSLHTEFAALRHHGEWFDLDSPSVLRLRQALDSATDEDR